MLKYYLKLGHGHFLQLAFNFNNTNFSGYAVPLLVDALRHKPEGQGFDSRWQIVIFH
jgi:hypothetical protein